MVWITSLRGLRLPQINNFPPPCTTLSLSHSSWAAKNRKQSCKYKAKKKNVVQSNFAYRMWKKWQLFSFRMCSCFFHPVSACTCKITCGSSYSFHPSFPLHLCLSHARHSGSNCRSPPRPVHYKGERYQCEQGEPCQRHRSCHSVQEVSATHAGETGGRKEKQKGINCRVNLTRHKDLSRGVGVECHPAVMKKYLIFIMCHCGAEKKMNKWLSCWKNRIRFCKFVSRSAKEQKIRETIYPGSLCLSFIWVITQK